MRRFVTGQRWVSEMEPELGIGVVDAVDGRRLHLRFPESGLTRIYAVQSAPLRRVVFHPGDRVVDPSGKALIITAVESVDGVLTYCAEGGRLREDQLAGALTLDTPQQRLMAGQREPIGRFDLRRRLLDFRRRMIGSPVYGLVGGRVDLIAHQIAIAAEVSSRRSPRVLLADETGLGKTIEAGLILHRLLVADRIHRVLVVVPDALVVQWYVELARRFNLRFRIFDDSLTTADAATTAAGNPFSEEALGLCGFSFLTGLPPARQNQLLDEQWDMLVVDEAHHLQPNGPLFERVASLSREVARVLLITATPGHLATQGHFARLRLLDPDRYPDYGRFREETRRYEWVADLVRELERGEGADPSTLLRLARRLDIPAADIDGQADSAQNRRRLRKHIIDCYGTGRSMFKTTRRTVSGFPGRRAQLVPLEAGPGGEGLCRRIDRESAGDCGLDPIPPELDFKDDPRIAWLVAFLRTHRDAKMLLICRTAEKVNALHAELETRINLRVGRYHEAMTLVQRDRNAAWFADPEGAVLLICSEIGSEGRNFQFARHLLLFDLPPDPDLLEQRIGRLDRIGQTGVVQVLVPYVRRTAGAILARWYHEGLDVFARHVPAAAWVTRRLWAPLTALMRDPAHPAVDSRLKRLIRCGRIAAERQQRRIEAGRDRLLALDALPPSQVNRLMDEIRAADADSSFLQMIEPLFDVWGIVMEPIAAAVYRLRPDHRYADPLPGFRPSGLTVTTDRKLALTREEFDFLTWDHPLVTGAMDLYLGSGKGNAAFACWPTDAEPALFLELLLVLEATALSSPEMQAFLPPTPLRVVVDTQLQDAEALLPEDGVSTFIEGSAARFNQLVPALADHLPRMVAAGRGLARERAQATITAALRQAEAAMHKTVDRLTALSRLNATAIDERDRDAAKREWESLLAQISKARLRLDALRLVVKGAAG